MSKKQKNNDDVKDDDTTNPSVTPPTPPPVEARAPAPEPMPAWVTAAKMLCPRASDGNGAWHDFFKEALPSAAKAQWAGPTADYSYYEGGRVLVAYRASGFFAVMTTPALEKTTKPGVVGPTGLRL